MAWDFASLANGWCRGHHPKSHSARRGFSLSIYTAPSGTYWYHAHAGLQEQQGLYGAFLIDPPQKPRYQYSKDYVVVLSIGATQIPIRFWLILKKKGITIHQNFHYPSLAKFIHDYRKASTEERKNLMDDYKMMQKMRMSIYDISDVVTMRFY